MARIRLAIRSLRKAPLVSLVVIFSVGLGIGANTAIFSLLHQVILRSLPIERPEELAVVTSPGDFKGGRNSTDASGDMDYIFSYPVFRELEKHPVGVTGVAAFRTIGANLSFQKQTVPGSLLVVSGGYFPLLGVKPALGRTILPEDDAGAGNPVAMISYGYWRDRLGGQANVLNQPLRVNGQIFTVVGVAPKGFTSTTLGEDPDAYVPLAFKPLLTPHWNGTDRWDDYWLYLLTRPKPGVTRAQAQAALNTVFAGLVEQQTKMPRFHYGSKIERFLKARLTLKDGSHGQSEMRDQTKTPLLILMAASLLVLLIAVTNAASLLLARSADRRREMAIRAAMGGGRGALMGQMLVESLLLAVAGGAAGLLFATATLRLLLAELAGGVPMHYLGAALDVPVLLFGLGLATVTGLIFGLYPAWEATRVSVADTLKSESLQSSGTRSTARVRKVLVCAQVLVSTVLLISGGLFLKSLVNILHIDLGMKTENVIGFSVAPALNGYTPERTRALFEQIESQMAAIPGVRSVSAAQVPLIAGDNWGNDVTVEGAKPHPGTYWNSRLNEIGPGYFANMGIPLMAGREFTESDNLAGPEVGVVNQTFVKQFLDGRNPIGLKFGSGKPEVTIVGVVKDSHYSSVKQAVPPVYYTPWRQDKEVNDLNFYVRSALPPGQVMPQIRRVLAHIDSDLPADNLRTLDEQINLNIQNERMVLQLSAVFAILAATLAMLGLYAVMAHSVARRRREIGIRMAMGAAPARIRLMVLRELLWILGIGLAAGVPAALALARYAKSQLYEVQVNDASVVAGVVLLLSLTSFAAGFLPARRAARISPMDALRYE
jgi:putative ABC transport system permease protein